MFISSSASRTGAGSTSARSTGDGSTGFRNTKARSTSTRSTSAEKDDRDVRNKQFVILLHNSIAFTLFCREFGNVVNNAFLVLIFWAKNSVGAIFSVFCNYAYDSDVTLSYSWNHLTQRFMNCLMIDADNA